MTFQISVNERDAARLSKHVLSKHNQDVARHVSDASQPFHYS